MLNDLINLIQGEHIENLGENVNIIVSKEHTFGTDALILADFASPKRKDIVCDLGTGCGIIPFLWYRDGAGKDITAVEIQENACYQVERSLELNKCDKIHLVNCDLKNLTELEQGIFNVVTMNPPYKIVNGGIKNNNECATIARHETLCTIDDISKCASRLLKFGGKFSICHRPERVFDAMVAMRKNGIEPKRLRFVQKKGNTQPWLCLIEGKKGGKIGLKVEAPFIVYNYDGTESDEMLRLTEKYRENLE